VVHGNVQAIQLHFEDEGSWYCLPEWADYFISVGRKLAEADRNGGRLVVALAVPTRAYAAAFVSLGMVISDAANRMPSQKRITFRSCWRLGRNGSPVSQEESPAKRAG